MLKLKGDINYRKLQEPRVGVYICHCGGNISDIVDMEQTAGDIAKLPKVIVSRHIQFMCSDSGQETIVKDIQEMGLNRIVVASCSPKLHELTFRHAVERAGLNPYLYQHMNIREQVSWCTHDDPQGATYKATRLVAAAVAKAIRLEPLRPIRMDAYPHVIVVGGGISGLKASLDISKHGIGVTLLEKTPFLGGHTAQLDRVYPTEDKALDIVDELVNQVINEPLIQVYTYAQISCIEGYIGNFKVTIKQQPRGTSKELASVEAAITSCPIEIESNFDYGLSRRKAIYRPYENSRPSLPAIDWQCCNRCGKCANAVGGVGIELDEEPHEFELQAGAIIVAAGFDHYEPHHGEFGYGKYPEVITLPQLTRLLSPNGPTGGRLEWNGQKPKNIAMIHCVGSRQIEGIHNPDDDGKINEYCSRVCCTATLQAANEIREILPDANIFDFYRDIRTYGRGHEDYYENASHNHVLFFRYNPEDPPVVEKSDDELHSLTIRVKDTLTENLEILVPVDLVVLSVGMIPHKIDEIIDMLKLPVGLDRYLLEIHPKLRPVETAINGVLLAGTAQGPKDISESCEAASAAAAKGVAMLSRGYVELDPYVAVVDQDRCSGSGKCAEACAYSGAIKMEEVQVNGASIQKATINPALCKGCGSCAAVCSNNAIEIKGWTLRQFEAMVDAIVESEEEPVIGGVI